MKEFSDEQQPEIKEQVDQWLDEFERNKLYGGLTEAQREESNFITEVFAELMYNNRVPRLHRSLSREYRRSYLF